MRVRVEVEELRIIRDLGEKGWYVRLHDCCEGEAWKVEAINPEKPKSGSLVVEDDECVLNALERLVFVVGAMEKLKSRGCCGAKLKKNESPEHYTFEKAVVGDKIRRKKEPKHYTPHKVTVIKDNDITLMWCISTKDSEVTEEHFTREEFNKQNFILCSKA